MSRARTTETSDLPPGIIVRKRVSGDYYYYQTSSVNAKRREYPLGKVRSVAITRWRAIATELPLAKRKVGLRPWVGKVLHASCKANAKRRGIEFAVAIGDIDALLIKSKGKCALTGIAFDLWKDPETRVRHWAPSLDRIDCKIGYLGGNIRVVANVVNVALSDFGEEVLLRIAKGIVKTKYGKMV